MDTDINSRFLVLPPGMFVSRHAKCSPFGAAVPPAQEDVKSEIQWRLVVF